MRPSRVAITLLAVILTLGVASNSYADISNAAVLFLRIAPGSRAAGMGEAFVAIADDASATHWNPAGLGNYPLSNDWIEAEVPERYRPITAIAPLSTGGTRNYLNYDIWAIGPTGLIRYDNKHWSDGEIFDTKTDETVEDKVRLYFNVTDDERLVQMIDRVAAANNRGSYEELSNLSEQIRAAVPDDFDDKPRLQEDLDSMLACYRLCRLRWDRVKEAQKRLAEGLKDSVMTDTECDRVTVAIERSRMRFLPEELVLPYNALFGSEVTAIASNGEDLLVGSSEGLARFNGTNWRYVTAGDELPSNYITALCYVDGSILVGTDSGVAVFNGLTTTRLTTPEKALPSGVIQALGGTSANDIYAVVNNDLYHFDGRQWRNTTSYQVEVDDSIEKIAARFQLYGGTTERGRYIEKYRSLAEAAGLLEKVELHLVGDEIPSEDITTADMPDGTEPEIGMGETGISTSGDVTVAEGEADVETKTTEVGGFSPGDTILVPFLAEIKSHVNAIYVDFDGSIWLGTEHGVFYLEDSRWNSPGYTDHEMVEGETLESLARQRAVGGEEAITAFASKVSELNDLVDDPMEVGEVITIPTNPAADPVSRIAREIDRIYFATEVGLIEYDGVVWSRSDVRGTGHDRTVGVNTLQNEIWIACDDRVVVKARGRSEVSFMHVKWLPELADDLYYEFLSVVTQKEGWGTLGGNITFISYGKFARTNEGSPEIVGEFESFDIAFTGSFGMSLTNKLKSGISAKVIYSRLSDQGAGQEAGSGTSTGFGIDVGLLYLWSSRLTLGMAITNIGPKMAYIDAAQSDDIPRNLAIGFAYKLLQSDYNRLVVTAEINKMLVGLDDGREELRELVLNGGAEFTYANLIAVRAGYIFDEEGQIKTPTLGFGLSLFEKLKFDFAYIPSQEDFSLANTLRISLGVML